MRPLLAELGGARPLGGGPGPGAARDGRGRAGGAAGPRWRPARLVVPSSSAVMRARDGARGGDDLVLVGLGLGGDLGLGGLELGGVVDPGGLAVELLVGQLGVASVVLASRLLVAHCASLASWWWPLG